MQNKSKKMGRDRPHIEPLENRTLLSGYSLVGLATFRDGGQPGDGLIQDSAGNLFGTTQAGGTHSTGSVFELPAGGSKITTLASFPATTTGSLYPSGVVLDAAGNLFGMTDRGGTNGTGSIFEVVKNSGVINTLASFNADNSDGANVTGAYPEGNLLIDSSGNLFGTTVDGGQQIDGSIGGGTYFELTSGASTITPLAVFPTLNSMAIGGLFYPARPNFITRDAAGNIFGNASGNAQQGYDGYVWEIPANSSTVNMLATFSGNDGVNPFGPVAVDASDNVFGTTVYGGTNAITGSTNGAGTVWEVHANSGAITSLASFNQSVGYSPDGVAMDASGNLFGTANYGGNATPPEGAVWELPTGASSVIALTSFGAVGSGHQPNTGVLIGSTGNLYGMTFTAGGTKDAANGSVFELIAPGNALPAATPVLSPVVIKTSLPPAIVAGTTAHGTVTVSIANNGSTTSSTTTKLLIYASTTGVIDANSTLLGSVTHTPAIKAGKTGTVVVPLKPVPNTLNGTYTLLAQTADALGATKSATIGPTVQIAPPFIAFTDTLIKTTLAPAVVSGQASKANLQVKIVNNGNIVSTGTTTIALYASPDGTTASSTLIRNYPTEVVLKPGASKTITVPLLTIPSVPDGNYFLVAKVTDPRQNITTAVSASTFNQAAPFVLPTPTISSITLPTTIASGTKTSAAINVTATNNGNVSPTTSSTISVYASTDGTVGTGTLITTATLKPGLKPTKFAKTKIALGKFTLLTPGTYFLVVQITGTFAIPPTAVSAITYTVT